VVIVRGQQLNISGEGACNRAMFTRVGEGNGRWRTECSGRLPLPRVPASHRLRVRRGRLISRRASDVFRRDDAVLSTDRVRRIVHGALLPELRNHALLAAWQVSRARRHRRGRIRGPVVPVTGSLGVGAIAACLGRSFGGPATLSEGAAVAGRQRRSSARSSLWAAGCSVGRLVESGFSV
jgi:hypothetical protein